MNKPTNSYFSTSLEKGLRILGLFKQDRTILDLKEITRLTGMNKTSAYRYVNTLVELGFLKKDPLSKQVKLGPKAIIMGHGFVRGADVLQRIQPLVDEFHESHQVTIDLALLDEGSLFILYRRETANTLTYRLPTITGSFNCSALGKAALAFLSDSERDEILGRLDLEKRTPNTIVDRNEIVEELRRTRERGYALNNEEYIPGIISIGAPLLHAHTGKVIGSVAFDSSTMESSVKELEDKFSQDVTAMAHDLSELLSLD